MSTVPAILATLQSKGTAQYRKTYARHGMAPDRLFGVSTADMKAIAKTMRGQQALACSLFDTGKMEAMYIAGMVADGAKMTADQLNAWVEATENLRMIAENTIPWVTVENPQARRLALAWMKSKKEHIATAGWFTYSGLLSIQPDEALDLDEIEKLMAAVVANIATAPNRVRYTMNNFVISVGTYVKPLLKHAKQIARELGPVSVDVGDTDCKIPLATAYIEKVEAMGRIGRKRKTLRC